MENLKDEELLGQLGRRIKQLRIAKGYSNYEHFAYELGMSRSQYGKYETGHNLNYLTLHRIVEGLGMTLQEFFCEGFEGNQQF
jgi:transcriptional regulator with XRE-family HTH domain